MYTAASVAYGWAGALMRFRQLFGKNFNSVTNGQTDGRTDGPTDGPTDRVTYRVVCMQLKIKKNTGGLKSSTFPVAQIVKKLASKTSTGNKLTASVAYGWAGEVMPLKKLFGTNFNSVMY